MCRKCHSKLEIKTHVAHTLIAVGIVLMLAIGMFIDAHMSFWITKLF